ncbi:MAG: acyltransferase [Cyanobacteria bacterium J06631_2]
MLSLAIFLQSALIVFGFLGTKLCQLVFMKISRKNNFDLIRLLAALVVVAAHTADVSQYAAFEFLSATFSSGLAVDVFFIISGFLIFRSFKNSSSLVSYFQKRARRILPAYVAVILISAVGLSFVSSLSFAKYFNLEFIKYIFFNLITLNFLQPTLPGVFENQEFQAVNMSLWTIKVEIMFYLVVPLIAYWLNKTNKVWGMVAIYLSSILYTIAVVAWSNQVGASGFVGQLEQQLPGQLALFISGAFLYSFYDKFRQNILAALAIATLILTVHNFVTQINFAYPIALAVFVLYFCLMFKYLGNFGKYGDFSYGIYIWHFPILQVFVHFNLFEQPFIATPLLFLCVFAASFISWNWIEKPFLKKRSHYTKAAETTISGEQKTSAKTVS